MTSALRLILCVFLALNITPNETQKPILRGGDDNVEDLENVWDEDRDVEENDRRYTERDINQNSFLIGGFENENMLQMLRAVDQVVDSRNEDAFKEIYTQRDDSYEEKNYNKFEDVYDSRIEDGQSVEVENERINKLLAMPQFNNNPNTFTSESSERVYSLKPYSNDQDSKSFPNLLSYIRDNMLRKKKKSIWKTCSQKAAKVCRKACVAVVNSGCTDCKRKLKKRIKKECKESCKDRFTE